MKREQVFIAALAAVAWADGVLHAREVVFFRQTLEELALPAAEEAEALRAVLFPCAPASIPVAMLSPGEQERLFAFAYLMARSDKVIHDEELRVLRELAATAGFPWERAELVFEHASEVAGLEPLSGPLFG